MLLTNFFNKKIIFFLLSVLSLVFLGCKSDDDLVEEDRYNYLPATKNKKDKVLDSLYMYINEVWLWQKYLSGYSTLGIRKYATVETALYNILGNIKNPTTGLPFEKKINDKSLKYSYVIPKTRTTGKTAGSFFKENVYGFGLNIGAVDHQVSVIAVVKNSPAATAGILRGNKIIKINNIAVKNISEATALLNNNSYVTLILQKPTTNKNYTVKLTKSNFYNSPVFKYKTINLPQTKIGYLAYGSFNGNSKSKTELENIFSDFSKNNVRTLVVDLRYNQGGYVSSVRYLSNLIAPLSINGKLMYSEHYNEVMQQRRATILKNQPYFDRQGNPVYIKGKRATYYDVNYSVSGNTYSFDKKGTLNISHIYFITSNNTASASEMLINIFKPYINTDIVGTKTYGKPVGFFGVGIADYTVYLSSFLIKNAKNNSDYFDGIAPTIPAVDDITKDFGDENEYCMKKIIQHIKGIKTGERSDVFKTAVLINETPKMLIKQ